MNVLENELSAGSEDLDKTIERTKPTIPPMMLIFIIMLPAIQMPRKRKRYSERQAKSGSASFSPPLH